jgi:hypothetical protein
MQEDRKETEQRRKIAMVEQIPAGTNGGGDDRKSDTLIQVRFDTLRLGLQITDFEGDVLVANPGPLACSRGVIDGDILLGVNSGESSFNSSHVLQAQGWPLQQEQWNADNVTKFVKSCRRPIVLHLCRSGTAGNDCRDQQTPGETGEVPHSQMLKAPISESVDQPPPVLHQPTLESKQHKNAGITSVGKTSNSADDDDRYSSQGSDVTSGKLIAEHSSHMEKPNSGENECGDDLAAIDLHVTEEDKLYLKSFYAGSSSDSD